MTASFCLLWEHEAELAELQIRCVKIISIDTNSFISRPNPMFDHLLESSRRDDSIKWSNIGFGQEIMKVVSIEVNLMHLISGLQIRCIFLFLKCLFLDRILCFDHLLESFHQVLKHRVMKV